MEQLDYEHCRELEQLEELIEEITNRLNERIKDENDLEIILLSELDNHEIKDTLSLKNKFVKLRTLSKNENIKDWVNDWVRAEADIKILSNKKRQVEGKRDSKKKIFNVLPK